MNKSSSSLSLMGLILFLGTLALLASSSSLYDGDASAEYREWLEFKRFREWKRSLGNDSGTHTGRSRDQPPPIDQPAKMARYIVNQAAWTSVATVSSRKDLTQGYPFVNIISFSDGPIGNGTGTPYLFLTPLDFTAQDVFQDNRATLMMSLVQGKYCAEKGYDPMDPRCARVVFSGKIKAVKEDNPEFPVAQSAVFGRHPWLAHMPADHHFFFAKLKIGTIAVLDTFGGPKYVSVEDYMSAIV